MHECVTTSTYSTRAKPEGCMYLWLRMSALYSYSPAWGVLNVNVEFLIQSRRENSRSRSRAAQAYKRAGPGSEIMALNF